MMNAVILTSLILRVAGVGYSLVLLSKSGDRRFGFLTVMLSLMATRQLLSAQHATSALEEVPGLAVSVFALLTVYYLSSYVVEEQRLTDRLRGFRKAIEHAGHAILLTDTDGTIEYANPAVESVVGHSPEEVVGENPRLWKSGEHEEDFYAELWDRISSGSVWEGEIVNRRRNGDLCWVDMTIAPVTDEDDAIERYVAVERDVTDRKEREHRIQEQNERLDRLNNTNEVLRDVNRDLVAASTHREIERVVCDRFARSDLFEGACILMPGIVDERVDVRTCTGLDAAQLEADVSMAEDVRRTIDGVLDRGSPTFVDAGLSRLDDPGGIGVLVPLSYQDADYGVLYVEAAEANAFEAVDTGLFADLGLTVGDAINAAESRQTLASDDVTELEFRVDGADDPFVRLSDRLDCTVELEGVSDEDGDGRSAYVSVNDCDVSAVSGYVAEAPGIGTARPLCDHEDRSVFRLRTAGDSVVTTLARYGAAVRALEVTEGRGRLVADVSCSNDIRSVVEATQSVYPDIDLVAQRERERETAFETEFQSAFEESLTARQLEAAQTAYFAGFFEWPRDASGEEVASKMDITQSTFTQHLRSAERKLFQGLFDERPNTVARSPNA